MTEFKNTTGSKLIRIKTDAQGSVIAMLIQVYNGEEQVLQTKFYSNEKNAQKWAKKII